MDDLRDLHLLGISVALGFLVGTERGWQSRELQEGTRVAGVRTFALTGLLGGCCSYLARSFGSPAILAVGFLAYGILVTSAYVLLVTRQKETFGATTEVAAILTFALGAMAAGGQPLTAAAATVAVLVLLRTKSALHGWVSRLQEEEISAAIVLLLISVVVLPLLPHETVDPWGAISPFQVWWMVVLLAGLSFAGYVAVRLAGPQHGILLTAVLGGLVSSTAVTLTLSRIGRGAASLARTLAAGILAAGSIMMIRVLVLVGVVHAALLPELAVPLGGMLLGSVATVVLLRPRRRDAKASAEVPLKNPLELGSAIRLTILIVVIRLLSAILKDRMGSAGIYILAAVAGLTDVDAITLSLTDLAKGGLEPSVAVTGIAIAVVVNTCVKAGLAWFVGGPALGKRVAAGAGLSMLLGAAAWAIASR